MLASPPLTALLLPDLEQMHACRNTSVMLLANLQLLHGDARVPKLAKFSLH